ncbi:DUF6197 family protein [Devosia epidermidihirudinis]|nr:hypothetical protein [Devosia epidermidihirudinis]
MATVRENLIAARALIDTPEKWRHGSELATTRRRTILSALDEVTSDQATFEALTAQSPRGGLVFFNKAPGTTHSDIMALFDRAIGAQGDPA